mmetsp:Transcript_19102/g.48876  ORF Transcript_19102/g.48876 Transcript_19102/m.48876 type:complete len:220 (-) Transcript_19102:1566-2225(-)
MGHFLSLLHAFVFSNIISWLRLIKPVNFLLFNPFFTTGKAAYTVWSSIFHNSPTLITSVRVTTGSFFKCLTSTLSASGGTSHSSKGTFFRSMCVSYKPFPNWSAINLEKMTEAMVGRRYVTSCVVSMMMTQSEMVMRAIPLSMPAAPRRAYDPTYDATIGFTHFQNSPYSLPSAAPVQREGTKRPDGTAMPYVMHARHQYTAKKQRSTIALKFCSLWKS